MSSAATNHIGPRWLLAARHLIRAYLLVSLWLWIILVLLLVVFHILMSGIIPGRVLIAGFGTHVTTWFPFVLSVIFVLTYLPVHVTSGGTRRSFIRAHLISGAFMGTVYAVVFFGLVLTERAIFGAVTDPAAVPGTMIYDSPGGMVAGQGLMTITAIITGALVAMGYYRSGGLLGTLLLIPALVPLLAVIALVSEDEPVRAFLRLPDHTGGTVLASLAALAVAAVAFHLITRHVPIAPVEQK